MTLTDTHCHLDRYEDPEAVVERARSAGVRMMCVTFLPSAYEELRRRFGGMEGVDVGLGFHPMASRGSFPWLERIDIEAEIERFPACAADASWIGEVGLDFSPEGAPHRALQERMLDAVLAAPGVADKFLSIHARYACRETVDRLVAAGARRATIHGNGFTGTREDAEYALAAGYHFSAVVPMLLDERREIVRAVPRDRLLIETDGPFGLVGGRALEPAGLRLAADALAELWGTTDEEMRAQLDANLAAVRGG